MSELIFNVAVFYFGFKLFMFIDKHLKDDKPLRVIIKTACIMPVAFLYYGVFLFSTVDGDARGTFISFSFIFGFILIISFTLLFFSAIAVIETKFFNYKKSRNDDE